MADSIFPLAQKLGTYESPFDNWLQENEEEVAESEIAAIDKILDEPEIEITIAPVPLQSDTGAKPEGHSSNGFDAFIDLIREVEDKLISSDEMYEDIEERIHIIRGVFYGTPWSLDRSVEGSWIRDAMFNRYTYTTMPADIRKIIGMPLFKKLFLCAEIYKDKTRSAGVDFGHLIIGLDARRRIAAREFGFPAHPSVSGLEAVTWVGDIGGAVGMLSINRTDNPKKRAKEMFKGSSFGGWINLEGDIAAYLVARDTTDKDRTPSLEIPEGSYIADVLANYLNNKDQKKEFLNRAKIFLTMMGARYDKKGKITNKVDVQVTIASKLVDFGEVYMVNRLIQTKRDTTDKMLDASSHLIGAAAEVAMIFVDVLEKGISNPAGRLEASGIDPEPNPKGKPFRKYVLAKAAEQRSKKAQKQGTKLLQEIENKFNELRKKF